MTSPSVASADAFSYTSPVAVMDDHLLNELRDLPIQGPDPGLRREVRVAALERLERQQPQSWWQRFLQRTAIPLALSVVSLLYLLRAAADTPLLR